MPKAKKNRTKKPSVKVNDLRAAKNPKGGVSLNYSKIEVEYKPQTKSAASLKPGGSLDAGVFVKYDIKGLKEG